MATVTLDRSTIDAFPYPIQKCQWTPLTAANNVGSVYTTPGTGDRTVQIAGTFDSATVIIQGSNDGTNYSTLTDPLGNPLSATTAILKQVSEFTPYIRPSTSGGGGSQSITITLITRVSKV